MHFLDPKNDLAFKRIFSNEHKKDILISFLNTFLNRSDDRAIIAVTLLSPNQVPKIKGAKETIVDVRCRDQRGFEYIVEMQVLPEVFFDKRVLYYVSNAYAHQLDRGRPYQKLTPVIFLGILNFKFSDQAHYHSHHRIQNVETQEHLLKDFEFHFIELPKFHGTEQELDSLASKWLYFLKYASELSAIPDTIDEPVIQEAFELANESNWDKKALRAYEEQALYRQQQANQVHYGYVSGLETGLQKGRHEGLEEGMQKGLEEGLQKGQQKGLEEGLQKGQQKGLEEGKKSGEQQSKRAIATALLQRGNSVEVVAEITGLTQEEVAQLK